MHQAIVPPFLDLDSVKRIITDQIDALLERFNRLAQRF
jgi:hypothetical protein